MKNKVKNARLEKIATSMEGLRSLAERDVTELGRCWGLLPGTVRSLLVDTLLLERSRADLSATYGRTGVWDTVSSAVQILQMLFHARVPREDAERVCLFARAHGYSMAPSVAEALCTAAGIDPASMSSEGAMQRGLGTLWAEASNGRRPPQSVLAVQRAHLGIIQMRRGSPSKEAPTYSRAQFERMCQSLCKSGAGQPSTTGFLRRERREIRKLLLTYGPSYVKAVRGNLTRVQAFVLDKYLGTVVPSLTPLSAEHLTEVGVVAGEVLEAMRVWRGRKITAPRALPAWQKSVYRFNSIEEAEDFSSARVGRKAKMSWDLLAFSPVARFPAHRALLASNGGPVPDKFHGASNSVRGLSGLKLGGGHSMVFSSRQNLSLSERIESRSGMAANSAPLSRAERAIAKKVLVDKDHALLLMVLDKGMTQREAASRLGITQGAVSHRLSTALLRVRMAGELFPLPSPPDMLAMCREVLVGEEDKAKSTALVLSSLLRHKWKQTAAAKALGLSQPTVSSVLSRLSHKALESSGRLTGQRGATAHAWKVVSTLLSCPYLLQSVDLPHFEWDRDALSSVLS